MTAPTPYPLYTPDSVDTDDETHLVCPCSKSIAACGERLGDESMTDEPWEPGEVCIMCEVVADLPCPRCGE